MRCLTLAFLLFTATFCRCFYLVVAVVLREIESPPAAYHSNNYLQLFAVKMLCRKLVAWNLAKFQKRTAYKKSEKSHSHEMLHINYYFVRSLLNSNDNDGHEYIYCNMHVINLVTDFNSVRNKLLQLILYLSIFLSHSSNTSEWFMLM